MTFEKTRQVRRSRFGAGGTRVPAAGAPARLFPPPRGLLARAGPSIPVALPLRSRGGGMPGWPANDERHMPRLNLPRRGSPPQPLPSPARAAPLPGHHDPCTLGAPRTPARPGWRGVVGLLLGLTTLSAVPAQAQWVVTETVDCAPGLTTVCSVAVGGTAKGTLRHRAAGTLDEDGWAVMLEEGQTYQIDLKGIDTGDGRLPDPWVLLFDSGDNFLTDDAGGGVGRNARITYTVQRATGDAQRLLRLGASGPERATTGQRPVEGTHPGDPYRQPRNVRQPADPRAAQAGRGPSWPGAGRPTAAGHGADRPAPQAAPVRDGQ